jgi:hypothetical protein
MKAWEDYRNSTEAQSQEANEEGDEDHRKEQNSGTQQQLIPIRVIVRGHVPVKADLLKLSSRGAGCGEENIARSPGSVRPGNSRPWEERSFFAIAEQVKAWAL